MLIRLIIENFRSINNRVEFNMLPNRRYSKLNEHKYNFENIEILKLASIYGANASGKSNIVKAFRLLEEILISEKFPLNVDSQKHKLDPNSKKKPITIGVEFVASDNCYVYAIQLDSNKIISEELLLSGLGVLNDKILFTRDDKGFRFFDEFYEDDKNELLVRLIGKSILKPNTSLLKVLNTLGNTEIPVFADAYLWFKENIYIITPQSRARGLAALLDRDSRFLEYAKKLLCSFHVGITDIKIEKLTLNEYFGKNDSDLIDKITQRLNTSPEGLITINSKGGEEISIVQEGENITVKRILIAHAGKEKDVFFSVDEESDGTRRLLDFIPAFQGITSNRKVIIIDEIERSIHPVLTKEILKKFSDDNASLGQLIITTHESNLLDQSIFRKDEIWFSEKNETGETDLYSLSKFSEHHTIDIEKGYLNGRYGGIPFVGNLIDLNWHDYDTIQG